MSGRAQWIAFGVALVIVLGLVANYLPSVTLVEEGNGHRTWIVRAEGHMVTLEGVTADDGLVCRLDGPDVRVEQFIDFYTDPRVDPHHKIWIEGERVENPL